MRQVSLSTGKRKRKLINKNHESKFKKNKIRSLKQAIFEGQVKVWHFRNKTSEIRQTNIWQQIGVDIWMTKILSP